MNLEDVRKIFAARGPRPPKSNLAIQNALALHIRIHLRLSFLRETAIGKA
jgi:hypothetical protein